MKTDKNKKIGPGFIRFHPWPMGLVFVVYRLAWPGDIPLSAATL
jgi:hypothetical protein